MDEHDDDLEPMVREDAEEEVEAFPASGDEVDQAADGEPEEEADEPSLDPDTSEI